jgi:hypothetical protein
LFYHDVTGEKGYEYENIKNMFYAKFGGPICMIFLFVVGAVSIVHRTLFDWIGPAIDNRMKDYPYLIFFILLYLVYLVYNKYYDYFKKCALQFYHSKISNISTSSTVILINFLIVFSYIGHYFGFTISQLNEIPRELLKIYQILSMPFWILLCIIIVRIFLSHMFYNIAGLLIIIMLFCFSFL